MRNFYQALKHNFVILSFIRVTSLASKQLFKSFSSNAHAMLTFADTKSKTSGIRPSPEMSEGIESSTDKIIFVSLIF